MNKIELQACAVDGCSKDRYQGKLIYERNKVSRKNNPKVEAI